MKNSERIAELDAQVEALRAEVAQLRAQQAAHYCYPQPLQVPPWQQQPYWQQWQTICAAPVGAVYTINATEPYYQTFGNTGCAAPAATYVLTANGAN